MAPTSQEEFLNRQTCYRVSTPEVYNARFEVHLVGAGEDSDRLGCDTAFTDTVSRPFDSLTFMV